jgi:hypothetical protein
VHPVPARLAQQGEDEGRGGIFQRRHGRSSAVGP